MKLATTTGDFNAYTGDPIESLKYIREAGFRYADYSFSLAKRFWNDRIRIIIGGSVTTTGERIENDAVIDNISIEWRINPVGNQYLRFFYDKNYESILEGEIRETGVGYAYRRQF